MAPPGRASDQSDGRPLYAYALDVGTVALLGLAVWLLFFDTSDGPGAAGRPDPEPVAPADLEAVDAGGSTVPVLRDGDGADDLVLLFRTDCSVCARELSHWAGAVPLEGPG